MTDSCRNPSSDPHQHPHPHPPVLLAQRASKAPRPSQTVRQTRPGHHDPPSPDPSIRLDPIARDPILRNLSPSNTLRALRASSPSHHTGTELDLMKICDAASPQDREFGVRVAQTCKDLREWATEVEAWEWPGTFEPPARSHRRAERRRMLMAHSVDASYSDADNENNNNNFLAQDEDGSQVDVFCGSLPKELVEAYETRTEEIHRAMQALDVEGLKSRVRSVHILPKSAQTKSQDEYVSFRVGAVDDFTTLVTATILQALPYMSWLTRLLDEWSVRLQILRKVPGFLAGLQDTDSHLRAAWADMEEEIDISTDAARSVRNSLESTRKVLGSKVSALGQRLDSMLDHLQDRSESLPDPWIDAFENLEYTNSNYVVKIEQKLTGLAWEYDLPSTRETPGPEGLGIFTEPMKTVGAEPAQIFHPQPTRFMRTITSKERIESPLLGQHTWMRDPSLISDATSVAGTRQDSTYNLLMDDLIAESLDQPPLPDAAAAAAATDLKLARPHSAQARPHSVGARPSVITQQPTSPRKSSEVPPRRRPRHVPIDVAPYSKELLSRPERSSTPESAWPNFANSSSRKSSSPHGERPKTSGSNLPGRKSTSHDDPENKHTLFRTNSTSAAFNKLFKLGSGHAPDRAKSNASAAARSMIKLRSSTKSRKIASVGSTRSSSDLPPTVVSSPLFGTDDGAETAHDVSAALKRVSAQAPASDRSLESCPTTSPQAIPDWSDKEVVSAGPMSNKHASPITKHDSPFDHLRNSGQWPLNYPDTIRKPGSETPDAPIRSDAFEHMFIDSLPYSPRIDDDSYAQNLAAFNNYIKQLRTMHGIDLSGQDGKHEADEASISPAYDERGHNMAQRAPVSNQPSSHMRQVSNDSHLQPGFETSSALGSSISTAAIEDALPAGFHRPQVVHNSRSSRDGGVAEHSTTRKQSVGNTAAPLSNALGHDRSTRPAANLSAVDTAQSNSAGNQSKPQFHSDVPAAAHTASSQTVDQALRNRTSDVSLSSYYDAPSTISNQKSRGRSDTTTSEPIFPMPPNYNPSAHSRHKSEKDSKYLLHALRSDSERNIIGTKLGAMKPRPLAVVTLNGSDKRHYALPPVPPVSRRKVIASNDALVAPLRPSRRRLSNALRAAGNRMDQHVSMILQSIPGNIRFESDANATVIGGNADGSVTIKPAPPMMSHPQALRRVASGLTLLAVNPSEPSLKRHVRDGETKLYHLFRPGSEIPMKLLVRLLGDEERVIVRVGGGWMDLDDCLRRHVLSYAAPSSCSPPRTVVGSQSIVGGSGEGGQEGAWKDQSSALLFDGRRGGVVFNDDDASVPSGLSNGHRHHNHYHYHNHHHHHNHHRQMSMPSSEEALNPAMNSAMNPAIGAPPPTPFFGLGNAPTPPTLLDMGHLSRTTSSSTLSKYGENPDPLRSNPLLSQLLLLREEIPKAGTAYSPIVGSS